ncbi:MAG TPA: S41 family peptidase [Allosphingosinicella sp.]|nr:S41 family peptidase [Allosphingosinicella sp.]
MNLIRTLAACAVLVLTPALAASAQPAPPFDGRAYVDRAIDLARSNALAAGHVDWPAVTAELHRRASAARDAFDLYPALVYLLDRLGDQHSFLQLSGERAAAYRAARGQPFRSQAGHPPIAERQFSGRREIGAAELPIGRHSARWLVVPSFMGNRAAGDSYARTLYGHITAAPARCGYVLDFRGNGGGNMWPMLAGLSPLLANGELGAFVARQRDVIFQRDGAVGTRTGGTEQVIHAIAGWRPNPSLRAAALAILIDGGSASSGEIVPIMFVGRARTRFFGTPTYGASTSTEGFPLPDGANLVIATSSVADRRGRLYPRGLAPDSVVRHAPGGGDAPLEAAKAWLGRQAGCRG